jgi:predicted ATPase with chaperone activity
MRGKAMDMFNQTVAVKDIESLNKFIRGHMLEAHDWREKVNRLLTHFHDLSVAHQELVRARKAEALLSRAVDTLPLSARGRTRVARTAVTIAALAAHSSVEPEHVAEALSYRAPPEVAS